jgi:hypothetical protein
MEGGNGRRRAGHPSEHWDDDGEVPIELLLHLFDCGPSELSDVFDHFIVMLLDIGMEGVVGHGVSGVDRTKDE